MLEGVRGAAHMAATGVLLALATAAATGSAAPPSSIGGGSGVQTEEERRTALYTEGYDAASAGRWAVAKDRFAAALAIRASAKVYFSLAQAEEQLGQLASASRDYGKAIESARAAGESDVVSTASSALAAVQPRVPIVRVVIAGAKSASVSVDGQPIAAGTLVPVDPGKHRISASAVGMRPAQVTVTLGERQLLDVPVRLETAGEPSAAPTAAATSAPPASSDGNASGSTPAPDVSADAATEPPRRAPFPWRTAGLVAAGVGVVTWGLGSYFGLLAKSKYDDSNSQGCNGNDCTAGAAATRRDAISAGNTSTALFVIGGLLLAGGVAAWVFVPPSKHGAGLAVTPVAFASGGGLTMSGGWR